MIPVFIDCDTGVDDAMALLWTANTPEIDIVGISTVGGNVECEKTYENTRKLVGLINKPIPVYKGADKPMIRELVTAKHVHGEDGMSGISAELPKSSAPLENEKAWDAIYREAKKYEGEMVLAAVGPLTNVAIALAIYKELPSLLKKIVIMGGAAAFGNVTPAAEFNIYVDPEAAKMVFECGAPIYMFGLDVTEKAVILPQEIDNMSSLESEAGKLCYKLLKRTSEFYAKFGTKGNCLHDLCPLMYLVHPEFFRGKSVGVRVETKGRITRGKTVCDMYTDIKFGFENAVVMTDVDRESFVKIFRKTIERY